MHGRPLPAGFDHSCTGAPLHGFDRDSLLWCAFLDFEKALAAARFGGTHTKIGTDNKKHSHHATCHRGQRCNNKTATKKNTPYAAEAAHPQPLTGYVLLAHLSAAPGGPTSILLLLLLVVAMKKNPYTSALLLSRFLSAADGQEEALQIGYVAAGCAAACCLLLLR